MTKRIAETVVIGSGFAGTLVARALARDGRPVTVVERGSHVPWGEHNIPKEGDQLFGAVKTALVQLSELADTVRDVVVDETVHAAAQGNPVRAAGSL